MLVARPGSRRPLRGLVLGALATLVVAPMGWAPVAESAGEIVVYSSRHYGQEPALELFTRKTGIAIKMFNASDAELFERLKAEGDRTPADVLLTVDAGNLWNAARAGLLAPVDSRELQVNIPPALRDAQNRWFAPGRRIQPSCP